MKHIEKYEYEHIFIDNASDDNTVQIIKSEAVLDKNIKLVVNVRNFGPVRSPYYGLTLASGDAVILIASDLQDPPELISDYIDMWEKGFDIVLAKKPKSKESWLMQKIRKTYYKMLSYISEVPLENDATGAGLFDRKVIKALKGLSDPYPYFRGIVCELGFSRCTIDFEQPLRKRGKSKASVYGLFDQALLAMTKHSKLPLRIMTFSGLIFGSLTFLSAVIFLIAKLLFWDSFTLGVAPLLVGGSLVASMLFFFLGILGEYIGMILTHIRNLPLVVEKERVNFDED